MNRWWDRLLAAAVIGFVLVYWALFGWWFERLGVGHVNRKVDQP